MVWQGANEPPVVMEKKGRMEKRWVVVLDGA
jgi:hypothetical protein